MASNQFGRKLDPYRCLREPLGVKGKRRSIVISHNPSTIDQNQQQFPNLGTNDVIVPGAARLAFTITLHSEDDANRTVVQNLGRAIVKKTAVKISGNEFLSIDDSNVYHCYNDLWKTASERKNDHYQGIDTSANRNATRIRINAENKDASVWLTKPSPLLSATASASRSISSCWKATCHFTRARWETASSMNLP